MIPVIKSLWATATDVNQKQTARIWATLGIIGLLLIPIVVLAILVKFVHAAFSAMGWTILIVFGFVIEWILELNRKKQQVAESEQAAQQQMYNELSRRIAIAIIPAVSQVTGIDLQPEEIVYDLGVALHGDGFYYSIPRLLTEDETRRLHRLVITKLYGRVQIPRAEMSRDKIVLVGSDHVFVRNDPRIVQYFTANY